MSTTLTRPRLDRQPTVDALRFLGNGNSRRPIVAIASLALVTLCIAVFTSMYIHAGNRTAVLALTREVPQGHRINSSDLAVVRVSLSAGLSPVPARDLSRMVGRTAAVSLFPGTLLSLKELAVRNRLAPGQAVVGVATKAGQLPAGGVADGDTVDVVLTGSLGALDGGTSAGFAPTSAAVAAGQAQGSAVLAPNATVTGVATPTSSNPDTIVVSVLIPSSLAPLVASASAAGQIALVLVGASS